MGDFEVMTGSNTLFYPAIVDGLTYVTAEHETFGTVETGTLSISWSGLVASLRFEEDFLDESASENDGYDYGADFGKGKIGMAALFNGENYTRIDDSDSLDLQANGTISLWVYISKYQDYAGIVYKGDREDRTDEAYSLYVRNKNVELLVNGKKRSGSIKSKTILELHRWYHIVAGWSQKGMFLFINGKIDSKNRQKVVARISDGGLYIGSQPREGTDKKYGKPGFSGMIDQLTIWNRAIPENKIRYIYNKGKGR
jgi:hypothetical protein